MQETGFQYCNRSELIFCRIFWKITVFQDEIITTSHLLADYLQNVAKFTKNDKVYIVGSAGIGDELDHTGIGHFGIGVLYFSNDFFPLNSLNLAGSNSS